MCLGHWVARLIRIMGLQPLVEQSVNRHMELNCSCDLYEDNDTCQDVLYFLQIGQSKQFQKYLVQASAIVHASIALRGVRQIRLLIPKCFFEIV